MDVKYMVGRETEEWRKGDAQTVTFIVTEDCNLRCKYCYITHKASNKKMNFDVAKKFIDYLFTEDVIRQPAVILDFIGGEPFLEVDLIDRICDYFKWKAFLLKDDWYWNYKISICTNGLNYGSSEVQNFILKNKNKIFVTISIDGNKIKHDLQRVTPNNQGSYDLIMKNKDLWLSQFGGNTKVTFASDDLKYLKDSIINLWNIGVYNVSANVVFEDVWKEGDDEIFEEQLIQLADYIIDNHLFDCRRCSFFDDRLGEPYTERDLRSTGCGTGRMVAVGPNGKIYPCLRYKDYSLNNKEEFILGDVESGIDPQKMRPFRALMTYLQSDQECINCEVATGCRYCQALNYDEADTNTNFQRAKYICKMHKARVRANNYYWAKLYNKWGINRCTFNNEYKKMYFLLSNNFTSFCQFENQIHQKEEIMEYDTIKEGLEFCYKNFFKPIFVHPEQNVVDIPQELIKNFRALHIISSSKYQDAKKFRDFILVFEEKESEVEQNIGMQESIILNFNANNIQQMSNRCIELFKITNRININIRNINKNFNFKKYEEQLNLIRRHIEYTLDTQKVFKEINIITDLLFTSKHEGCLSGKAAFILAPNKSIYRCPSEYIKSDQAIGNLKVGINNNLNSSLFEIKNQPLCANCTYFHCDRCHYENKQLTTEWNIPSTYKCFKANLENNVASILCKNVADKIGVDKEILKEDFVDPLIKLEKTLDFTKGYRIREEFINE